MKDLIEKISIGKKLLSIYFVAGYPKLESTAEVILTLQECGVDIIEIGMPYADPLVDGTVIQHSGYQALSNGMNIDLLFDQLLDIKGHTHIPLVLMGYYNQIFRYGVERFINRAYKAGCSGILFPDLPLKEYVREVKPYADAIGVDNIQLITPHTDHERLANIIHYAQGFLYVVSNPMTTGGSIDLSQHEPYFQGLKDFKVNIPKLLGFGIDSREKLDFAYRYFDGAVIGSAFVKCLGQGVLRQCITDFFEQRLLWKIGQ